MRRPRPIPGSPFRLFRIKLGSTRFIVVVTSEFVAGFGTGFTTSAHPRRRGRASARCVRGLCPDRHRRGNAAHRGESVSLDPVVLEALRVIARALDAGERVAVVTGPQDPAISSQAAADILNVSRPHVVKAGEGRSVAARRVGKRVSFMLFEVAAYGRLESARRNEALASIAPVEVDSDDDFWVVTAKPSVRPVAVLDARAPVPAGLRDLLLSGFHWSRRCRTNARTVMRSPRRSEPGQPMS